MLERWIHACLLQVLRHARKGSNQWCWMSLCCGCSPYSRHPWRFCQSRLIAAAKLATIKKWENGRQIPVVCASRTVHAHVSHQEQVQVKQQPSIRSLFLVNWSCIGMQPKLCSQSYAAKVLQPKLCCQSYAAQPPSCRCWQYMTWTSCQPQSADFTSADDSVQAGLPKHAIWHCYILLHLLLYICVTSLLEFNYSQSAWWSITSIYQYPPFCEILLQQAIQPWRLASDSVSRQICLARL